MRRKLAAALLLATAVWAAPAPALAQVKPSAEWANKAVPLDVFAQFPQIAEPVISPDGTRVAAQVRANGEQVLAVVPLGGGAPEILARGGAEAADKMGARQIVDWRWIGPDHLLIGFLFRDNAYGQWFDVLRYAVYNGKTKRTVTLAWDTSILSTSVLWTSKDGPPRVVLQRVNVRAPTERWNAPEVIEVDADTGAERVLQRSNPIVSGWTTDADGVVRFGASRDRDTGRVRVLYRGGAGEEFRTVSNAAVDLYGGGAADLPDVILRGKGVGKAYALSRKDGHTALYEYDLATMALGRKLFGAPGYDVAALSANPTGEALDGVRYVADRSRVRWFDGRLGEIQKMLDEQFGAGDVRLLNADRAREKILFAVGAPGQVPAYYVYDTVKGGIGLLGYNNDRLKNAQLNPVSTVRYPTSDGKTIEAVLTLPRHRAGAKNLPAVVLPHGGPWARDSMDWNSHNWAQALAELGYVVLQPNFRGSDGYGREWEKAAEGNWGHRMSDDLNEGLAWLASQGIADPKRACIMGWSYGGYAAARAAQRDGKLYRCAIAGAAPVDMPAMVAYDRDYLGRYGAKNALGSAGADLAAISPALHAEQVSIPLLIVHGAKDQRVPVAQARGFVSRLKRAGKVENRDFLYVEQRDNTHNLLREADRLQFLTAVRDFLAKHNPA